MTAEYRSVHVILSPEADVAYEYLKAEAQKNKIARSILNSIEKKKEIIKMNIHYGEPVPKNLIPWEYTVRYDVPNLFWVGLASFWRMPYTIKRDEKEIVAFILDIIDHKEYDKKFGYRKR
jgi:hypothetical protein